MVRVMTNAGYCDGYIAVESYKGEWILRAALPQDTPIADAPTEAKAAMDGWMARNRAYRARLRATHE